MKLVSLLFLCATLLAVRVEADNEDLFTRRLYDSIIIGDYDDAVTVTQELVQKGQGSIIANVVNQLITNKNRNVIAYAYKLWRENGKDTVKYFFPIQFRLIVNEYAVKLINKRDGLAVKLGVDTDSINDRRAYGDSRDKISDRVSWKLIPFWENNRIYFKILNTLHNQYLKLELESDDVGEHKAWGADNADSYRHHWYLQPVKLNNEVLFFIYNREYNHALKLGVAVDSDGDRVVWGHNGVVESLPQHFAWIIEPF